MSSIFPSTDEVIRAHDTLIAELGGSFGYATSERCKKG